MQLRLTLLQLRADYRCSLVLGQAQVFSLQHPLHIGRSQDCQIRVQGGQSLGGRRSYTLREQAGRVLLCHGGHLGTFDVDGMLCRDGEMPLPSGCHLSLHDCVGEDALHPAAAAVFLVEHMP
jgi:hypothetical protein